MTLCYAFYFSFCGLPLKVPPIDWPLVWLGFATLVLVNPFPVFYPYSRRWILRKSGGLFLSGSRRVEVRRWLSQTSSTHDVLVPRLFPRRPVLQHGLHAYQPLFYGMPVQVGLHHALGYMRIA
jgi:hypothetical protein